LRILFFNRSYHPDVEATGQLLAELCSDLARDHDVTVIAGRPNFVRAGEGPGLFRHEVHDGVQVVRVRNVRFTKASLIGRAAGLLSYLFLALAAGLCRRRPDVIVVETDPPFLGLLGALLKRWHRCPLIYYLQDLYPEVGLAMGKLRPGLVTSLLRWTTQVGLRRADRVVVLGEDMKERVLRRGIDPARVAIVPNWADTTAVRPLRENNPLREQWGLNGSFAVMYSGNLGLSQNLDQVLEAARELRHEPVAFLMVGEGAAKAALMAKAAGWSLDNVRFLPYQPKERLSESLGTADLHLIPLQRGLAGCIVPSKLYGILAAGVPYVAAVEPASEVARVTAEHKSGLVIDPDAPEQLVRAIRWCLDHPAELRVMGENGRHLAVTHYDRHHAVAKFQRHCEQAAEGRASEPRGRAALAHEMK
jgi:glycosyltransferase involved in cell wall biosynthesis